MNTKSNNFKKPVILISEWLPMGRNNLLSINRHLGSHKQYNSPTEFAMKGSLNKMNEGAFNLQSSGFFLKPISYSFSGYLKAKIRNNFSDINEKGLELDKDGSCLLGHKLDADILIEDAKEFIRNSENDFTSQFINLLSESQQNLLKAAYCITDDTEISSSMSSYSLILLEGFEKPIKDSGSFLKDNKNIFDSVTDWITNHFTIDGIHFFIGIKAMVCIGENLSDPMKEFLKGILFQKTIFSLSLQLFSNLWTINKRIININSSIKKATYNQLKEYLNELSELNNNFSQQNIINDMLIDALKNKKTAWDVLLSKNKNFQELDIGEGFDEELEKAINRNLLIKQLQIDIANSDIHLQNKISMIMTKNGQQLNLTLLLLTLISVIGIAEIIGFSIKKTILVLVALTPFVIFTVRSFIRYRKNFS